MLKSLLGLDLALEVIRYGYAPGTKTASVGINTLARAHIKAAVTKMYKDLGCDEVKQDQKSEKKEAKKAEPECPKQVSTAEEKERRKASGA